MALHGRHHPLDRPRHHDRHPVYDERRQSREGEIGPWQAALSRYRHRHRHPRAVASGFRGSDPQDIQPREPWRGLFITLDGAAPKTCYTTRMNKRTLLRRAALTGLIAFAGLAAL